MIAVRQEPYKKESCFAGFSACGGSLCDRFHIRRSAIKAFLFYRKDTFTLWRDKVFPIE